MLHSSVHYSAQARPTSFAYRLFSIKEKKKNCVCVCRTMSLSKHSLTHAHAIGPRYAFKMITFSHLCQCGSARSIVAQHFINHTHNPFAFIIIIYRTTRASVALVRCSLIVSTFILVNLNYTYLTVHLLYIANEVTELRI